MQIVTLSSKNQITLPVRLLADLRVPRRGKLLLETETGKLTLKPLSVSIVQQTAGSLTSYVPPTKRGTSLDIIMRQTRSNVARHLSRTP